MIHFLARYVGPNESLFRFKNIKSIPEMDFESQFQVQFNFNSLFNDVKLLLDTSASGFY